MLRIAVPNKGSLSGPAAEMLHEAGYQQRRESKELRIVDPGNEVEFFYLRPRHRDLRLLRPSRHQHRRRPSSTPGASRRRSCARWPASTFRFATKPGTAKGIEDLGGMTVATSYEGIVAKHLADGGIDASVVHFDGAVETAIELGVAEVIADVVETGTSLRNAGLEVFGDPIMKSEAVVIRRVGADTSEDAEPKVQQFLRRLQGVLVEHVRT